jgi:hypothetical protein
VVKVMMNDDCFCDCCIDNSVDADASDDDGNNNDIIYSDIGSNISILFMF